MKCKHCGSRIEACPPDGQYVFCHVHATYRCDGSFTDTNLPFIGGTKYATPITAKEIFTLFLDDEV